MTNSTTPNITLTAPRPDSSRSLTSLRFFAALYVVLFHSAGVLAGLPNPHSLPARAVSLGYVSVSFFFLLSGYILAIAYCGSSRKIADKRRFYIARFARVYPLFLLTLFLDTPDWLVARAKELGGFAPALRQTALVLVPHLLMLHAWFPSLRGIDRPNWSLSVEAFLYLLFPFAAARIWKLGTAQILPLAVFFWIGGQAVLYLCAHLLSQDALMFPPIFHLSTFLLGIALARWHFLHEARLESIPGFTSLCLIFSIALSIPVILSQGAFPKAYLNDGLLAPIFIGFILAVAVNGKWPARILSNRALLLLGDSSYALYLFHFPILHYAQRLHLHKGWDVLAAYILFCITVSIVSYRYFETPLRRWITSRMTARLAPTGLQAR